MAAKFCWLLLLCLGSSVYSLVPPQSPSYGGPNPSLPVGGSAVIIPTPPPLPTLTQDLDEIYRMIQFKPLNQLIMRYLLNDAQFQAFVRIINSRAGITARWRLRAQPEIVAFQQWVNQQMMLSGGPLEVEEGEQFMSLLNPFPYWSATVFGWQGFLQELRLYLPQYAMRAHIDAKLLQQGIFAQFWLRLKALQPTYERWLTLAETQQLIGELQLAGIDTMQLDQIIREQFGWNTVTTTITATSSISTATATPLPSTTTAVPVSSPTTDILMSSTAASSSAPSLEPIVIV